MPASHGKQKQREKQKKKREAAKRRAVHRPSLADLSPTSVLRQAAALPVGRCFVSADVEDASLEMPRLVSVVITRRSPVGIVVPAMALVDRTCLGVKNAFVAQPMVEAELDRFITNIGEAHEVGMKECDFLFAQSVVFHAVDYARSLGFEPHKDFPEILFGPRPEQLLDTPLARPSMPVYVAGPDDRAVDVVNRLEKAVGPNNFLFSMGGLPRKASELLAEEDDGDEDDEDDDLAP
jgi:hypothetical protein